MAHKVLIALDSSEGAWRALEYVAETLGQTPGVQVTLLHILTGLPPAYWDDGHVLDPKEREARQRLVASWQKEQEKSWQDLVARAHTRLQAGGVPRTGLAEKFKPKYYDVAEEILTEAQNGGFGTIVMGRRGLGTAKSLLLGSVTNKVVQTGKGFAVTVVA